MVSPALGTGKLVLLLRMSDSSAFQSNTAELISRKVNLTRRSPSSPSLKKLQPLTSNSLLVQPYRSLVNVIVSPTSTESALRLKSASMVICSLERKRVSLAIRCAREALVVNGSSKSSGSSSPPSSATKVLLYICGKSAGTHRCASSIKLPRTMLN